ncbi:hypothetical protein WN51_05038 [Melipona quadrifasciata]|uniref:Uncharacterized protein n=1 Tax=Melipona quadrifasciata TaxID=166423 RepID=A0A0M8ZUA5_9HYME|nr:hypothetical protein WN51_05038 [Melipona quadrifasciata]
MKNKVQPDQSYPVPATVGGPSNPLRDIAHRGTRPPVVSIFNNPSTEGATVRTSQNDFVDGTERNSDRSAISASLSVSLDVKCWTVGKHVQGGEKSLSVAITDEFYAFDGNTYNIQSRKIDLVLAFQGQTIFFLALYSSHHESKTLLRNHRSQPNIVLSRNGKKRTIRMRPVSRIQCRNKKATNLTMKLQIKRSTVTLVAGLFRMRVARLLLCYVLLEDYSTNLGGAAITSDAARQDASATNPTLPGYIFKDKLRILIFALQKQKSLFPNLVRKLILGEFLDTDPYCHRSTQTCLMDIRIRIRNWTLYLEKPVTSVKIRQRSWQMRRNRNRQEKCVFQREFRNHQESRVPGALQSKTMSLINRHVDETFTLSHFIPEIFSIVVCVATILNGDK